MLYYAILFTNF